MLEVTNIQALQPLAANLQRQMVKRNTRVEFLAYLDADEVLTWPGGGVNDSSNDSSNDSPIQSATPPPSILPMLRATIGAETGNGAMYVINCNPYAMLGEWDVRPGAHGTAATPRDGGPPLFGSRRAGRVASIHRSHRICVLNFDFVALGTCTGGNCRPPSMRPSPHRWWTPTRRPSTRPRHRPGCGNFDIILTRRLLILPITSTLFGTEFRAVPSSTPLATRGVACSTWVSAESVLSG